MLRTFLSIIKYTLNKNDSGEIAAVKKASDHSDVDVCMTSAIHCHHVIITDEVIQIQIIHLIIKVNYNSLLIKHI